MATEKKRPHKETPSDLSAAPPTKKPKKKATLELADLPSFIFDPEFEKQKEQAEIDLHGGRVRSLPVMAGHWPTHIYLSVSVPLSKIDLKEIQEQHPLKDLLSLMKANKTAWTHFDTFELHVSLAKTFSLRHHELQVFPKQLGDAVEAAKIGGISLKFDAWQLLVNDTKSTSFASIVATKEIEQVLLAIATVDSIMMKFGHPTYYENPIIHASLAWTPCDYISDLASSQPETPTSGVIDPPLPIEGYITKLNCKIGKVLYSWSLEV